MSYADDLKHPLWQRRRLEVLQAAGFRCARCDSDDKQLHAHHKTYLRGHKPWEYPAALLECLCDPCHSTAHELKDRLELMVAEHPTANLPRLTRLIDKLGGVLRADSPAMRADAVNALQDELDAMQDSLRGPGAAPLTCTCADLRAGKSDEKWSDECFYENGHVSDCKLGEYLNEHGVSA